MNIFLEFFYRLKLSRIERFERDRLDILNAYLSDEKAKIDKELEVYRTHMEEKIAKEIRQDLIHKAAMIRSGPSPKPPIPPRGNIRNQG